MCDIRIRIGTQTGRVFVKSPYHAGFVTEARKLNGKWVNTEEFGGEWAFDGRDEQRVRDLCIRLYGTDGRTQASLVTLRVTLGSWDGSDITLGGRSLVRRKGRDYRVELGDGVVVLEGGFPSSGGSVKNPRVDARDGTVLEVRDYPEELARELLPDAERGSSGFSVEIVGEPYLPRTTPIAVDPLTTAVEAGLARINGEAVAVMDPKVAALAQIREIMNAHGITVDDLR